MTAHSGWNAAQPNTSDSTIWSSRETFFSCAAIMYAVAKLSSDEKNIGALGKRNNRSHIGRVGERRRDFKQVEGNFEQHQRVKVCPLVGARQRPGSVNHIGCKDGGRRNSSANERTATLMDIWTSRLMRTPGRSAAKRCPMIRALVMFTGFLHLDLESQHGL